MNYKSFNLGDWIGHISGAIEDERELDGNEMRNLVEFLSGLPRWIPVTERLPEEGYSVLVMRITDDNYKYIRVATYQGDCWMDDTDKFNKPNPHKVIAWMPLPEPYREVSE